MPPDGATAVYEAVTRTEVAKIGGVTLRIRRDWVLKLNTDDLCGPIDRKGAGWLSPLREADRAASAVMMESDPIPAAHGVVRRHSVDRFRWIRDELRITISKQTLSLQLHTIAHGLGEGRGHVG